MRPPRTLLRAAAIAAVITTAPALAVAQYASPPPGNYQDGEGFFLRRGITGGVGLGFGLLSTDSGIFECAECVYRPAAVGLSGHLGGMLDHRTAILGEYWAQAQQLDAYGDATGVQHLLMGALQYWLAPQLWVKGGLGLATLQVSYYDGFVDDLATGTAIMAAGGYEVAYAPNFALDIQLRIGSGMYRYVGDRASTAIVGVGASWF